MDKYDRQSIEEQNSQELDREEEEQNIPADELCPEFDALLRDFQRNLLSLGDKMRKLGQP